MNVSVDLGIIGKLACKDITPGYMYTTWDTDIMRVVQPIWVAGIDW